MFRYHLPPTTYYILFAILLLLPLVTLAHPPSILSGGYWGPLVSCSGVGSTPCTSLCDLIHTFIHIVYFGMTLALYVFAPILFVWGGLMILIAGASPDKLATGKKILTGTLIGVLIVLSSFLIVETFISILGVARDVPGFGTAFQCRVVR